MGTVAVGQSHREVLLSNLRPQHRAETCLLTQHLQGLPEGRQRGPGRFQRGCTRLGGRAGPVGLPVAEVVQEPTALRALGLGLLGDGVQEVECLVPAGVVAGDLGLKAPELD
jgi:hypothetical protein